LAPIRFVFCVHNHQPVGNFDHVIEDAYQRAYLPFLEVMERHPAIPWVLHNSGCLWEWLEENHPEYLDRIAGAVRSGRLEILGGGFYEPVLPALTPEDRRGQVEKMREYLTSRFDVDARGIWLTERVWEPDLPLDLVDAGISYLPIDDTQLQQIGVGAERIRGSFLTESAGRSLRLFPALMSLRYRIPFADPDEVVRFLRNPFPGGGDGLAVYADDGEKFGTWPGTHKLVYQRRWLDRFLSALEAAGDAILPTTFAREAREQDPVGLAYLPTGSYAEMGDWSLPAHHQAVCEQLRETLSEAGLEDEGRLFVRGGFWRNFFARYPESSWMHMRALEASGRCRAFRSTMRREAWENCRDHLWRAQCNCAYWHGVFGGMYLPHLRHGVYAELIRGEALLARGLHGREPWVAMRAADLDIDGHNEIVLENDQLALFLDPNGGGRLLEWDDRSAGYNLINVISRREEYYHRKVTGSAAEQAADSLEPEGSDAAGSASGADADPGTPDAVRFAAGANAGPETPDAARSTAGADAAPETPNAAAVDSSQEQAASIHGGITSKEDGLRELLTYDWYDRAALTDRFFDEEPDPVRQMLQSQHEIGDFVNQPYEADVIEEKDRVQVRLRRTGGLWRGGNCQPLQVEKTISVQSGERGYSVDYRFRNQSDHEMRAWAAIENHANLLAAKADDRFLVVNGQRAKPAYLGAVGQAPAVDSLHLVEGWANWHIEFSLSAPAAYCRYPVRTVSLSEGGAESNDQGLAILFYFPLHLVPGGEHRFGYRAEMRDGQPDLRVPAGELARGRRPIRLVKSKR